jgi:membrane protease YdiL (CAAX protease family)
MRTAGALVWIALLIGNGVAAPLSEEFAWRGYVQTRIQTAWGAAPAVVVAAALFAAKHVVVDRSVLRIVTLVTGALALGVVRARYGTTASSLAHTILNLAGTAASIAIAILTAPP